MTAATRSRVEHLSTQAARSRAPVGAAVDSGRLAAETGL